MLKSTLLAAGILGAMTSAASAFVEYDCGSMNGFSAIATLFDEEDVMRADITQLATGQSQSVILAPAISGSGFRYASIDPPIEFIGQGSQQGFLIDSRNGQRMTCTVTRVVEPGGSQAGEGGGANNGGIPGFSFGGNLRAGPGINFADVGGTFEGQQVLLVQNSEVFFNGFTFWLIQLPNGTQAYQWGGVLCAPNFPADGLFNDGC